eukprot:1160625-Pelagomonas_calceolata.AAC.4
MDIRRATSVWSKQASGMEQASIWGKAAEAGLVREVWKADCEFEHFVQVHILRSAAQAETSERGGGWCGTSYGRWAVSSSFWCKQGCVALLALGRGSAAEARLVRGCKGGQWVRDAQGWTHRGGRTGSVMHRGDAQRWMHRVRDAHGWTHRGGRTGCVMHRGDAQRWTVVQEWLPDERNMHSGG